MDREEKIGNVQYYLRENHLSTGEDNRYMAAVRRKEAMHQDQIVTLMTRKNTTISREEIELVLRQLKQVVTQQILSGYPVIMDLFKAQVTIKGGFTDGEDEFDDRRHFVNVSLTANTKFRKELAQNASIEKVTDLEEKAKLIQIYDYSTRSFSNVLPAGGLVSLRGIGLKPEEGDPEIVLSSVDGGEDFPVENLHRVTERDLMFNLPAGLAAGDYRVKLLVKRGLTKKEVEYGNAVTIG